MSIEYLADAQKTYFFSGEQYNGKLLLLLSPTCILICTGSHMISIKDAIRDQHS